MNVQFEPISEEIEADGAMDKEIRECIVSRTGRRVKGLYGTVWESPNVEGIDRRNDALLISPRYQLQICPLIFMRFPDRCTLRLTAASKQWSFHS